MFKFEVIAADEAPSLMNGQLCMLRGTALFIFDNLRHAEQARRAEGRSLYSHIALLTDREEDGRWASGDNEFPYMVDGESFES